MSKRGTGGDTGRELSHRPLSKNDHIARPPEPCLLLPGSSSGGSEPQTGWRRVGPLCPESSLWAPRPHASLPLVSFHNSLVAGGTSPRASPPPTHTQLGRQRLQEPCAERTKPGCTLTHKGTQTTPSSATVLYPHHGTAHGERGGPPPRLPDDTSPERGFSETQPSGLGPLQAQTVSGVAPENLRLVEPPRWQGLPGHQGSLPWDAQSPEHTPLQGARAPAGT